MSLTYKLSGFICLLIAVSACRAEPLNMQEYQEANLDSDESEGRLFFTSNGGLSLTNSTIDLNAILAAILIGVLILMAFGNPFASSSSGYSRTGYDHQQYAGQNPYDSQFYARSDKNAFDQDLAFQMDQLDAAFKAYNVDDEDCQKYVACEASQLERLEENGELAKEVLSIMTNLKSRKNAVPSLKRPFLNELLDTFIAGEFAREQEVKDACGKLRYRCTAIKKPY